MKLVRTNSLRVVSCFCACLSISFKSFSVSRSTMILFLVVALISI